VQISGESEESSAFLSSFTVPLREWCQLGVIVQGRAVRILLLTEDIIYHVHIGRENKAFNCHCISGECLYGVHG